MGRLLLWVLMAILFCISLIPCFALLTTANKHMQPRKRFPAFSLSALFGFSAAILALIIGLEFEAGVFTGMIFIATVSTVLAVLYVVGYFIWESLQS